MFSKLKSINENLDEFIKIEELINENINQDILDFIRNKIIDTDPMYMQFTSGSTGTPKGTMMEHQNIMAFSVDISHYIL